MKNTNYKNQFLTVSRNGYLPKVSRSLIFYFLAFSAVILTSCKKDDEAVPETIDKKEAMRSTATNFYKTLYSLDQSSIDSYVETAYTEHQISASFTLAGLKTYAKNRKLSIANHALIIHRTLVQGNLVGLHIEEKVTADSSVARMALFRFDSNGKIIEHWEAMQGEPRTSANPNTMFDGAAVNYSSTAGSTYLDATVVNDMKVFNNYDTTLVRQTRGAYIQHNPLAGNGPDALIGLLVYMKNEGFKTVATNHLKLAEGNFVMALNNYQTSPAFPGLTNSVAFDLIQLSETGKEEEHWDVLEEIGSADKAKAF